MTIDTPNDTPRYVDVGNEHKSTFNKMKLVSLYMNFIMQGQMEDRSHASEGWMMVPSLIVVFWLFICFTFKIVLALIEFMA